MVARRRVARVAIMEEVALTWVGGRLNRALGRIGIEMCLYMDEISWLVVMLDFHNISLHFLVLVL